MTISRVFPLLCLFLVALGDIALVVPARAQSALAAQVAKPVSLPDIVIGSPKATVTITEYASMSCPHCAAWGENVFPMLRARYIDTGKVRFVFREFPLDLKAAGASMLARCIAKGDAEKYLAVIETMYQQLDLAAHPHQGDADPDRQAQRHERAGSASVRDRSVPARQAEGGPAIRVSRR